MTHRPGRRAAGGRFQRSGSGLVIGPLPLLCFSPSTEVPSPAQVPPFSASFPDPALSGSLLLLSGEVLMSALSLRWLLTTVPVGLVALSLGIFNLCALGQPDRGD